MRKSEPRSKPYPGHKFQRIRITQQAVCECGWNSDAWIGKGGRGNALAEWRSHVNKCKTAAREKADA